MNKWLILELVFPALAAFFNNKKIRQEQLKMEKDETREREKIKEHINAVNDNTTFCKMVEDLYDNEMQRFNVLMGKAMSMLTATGFVISLISLTLAVKKDYLVADNCFSSIGVWIIILAAICFALSAVSACRALQVAAFHQVNIEEVNQIITQKVEQTVFSNLWAVEKMLDINLNYKTLEIKANWLQAAQAHFLYGIVFTVVSYIILVMF